MKGSSSKPSIYKFKITRQAVRQPEQTIQRPEDIGRYFQFMQNYDREHILRVDMNGANRMIGYEQVTVGTDCSTLVGPKEVFRGALLSGASSIIMVHNHPSGQIEPSKEDLQVSKKLWLFGEEFELQLLDFVIIGHEGQYYSLAENNLLYSK